MYQMAAVEAVSEMRTLDKILAELSFNVQYIPKKYTRFLQDRIEELWQALDVPCTDLPPLPDDIDEAIAVCKDYATRSNAPFWDSILEHLRTARDMFDYKESAYKELNSVLQSKGSVVTAEHRSFMEHIINTVIKGLCYGSLSASEAQELKDLLDSAKKALNGELPTCLQ